MRIRLLPLLSLLFFVPAPLWALSVPDHPIGRVDDGAGLLTADQRGLLESKLASFEQETSNQIVVVTFPSLEGESLEDFSIRLAEKWKIGQKGKDNGIILLIFPQEHLLRIEVGYGLESVVPDAYASQIIEEKMKPRFRQGNFYEGIDEAVESLMNATRGVYEAPHKARLRGFPLQPLLTLFLLIFLVSFSRRRGLVWIPLGGGWTLGGGSGSGWGGGGFGGGGGSFGGGGSSGSW